MNKTTYFAILILDKVSGYISLEGRYNRLKVAIYCRLSDEDDNKLNPGDESESIQNQKSLLEGYVLANDWNIYDYYIDDDWSGADNDRPDWNRLLVDAENKKFDIILCKSQSRFTRDMIAVEKYLHGKFLEWNIRFIGLVDNTDTYNKGNKKQRQILGLTNEWYLEDISDNIRAVFDSKRKAGEFIGGFATYGYLKDPEDSDKIIIDEYAADVVKMIYNWYLEGFGPQAISSKLNEQGILNPTMHKRELGLNFKVSVENNGLWNKTTVRRILKNPVYLGHMVQGRRRKLSYKSKKIIEVPEDEWFIVKNTHDAIIEEDVFDAVQSRMASRPRSSGLGKPHVFAGKLRCLDCGSNMNRGSAKTKKGIKFSYYRCKLYIQSPSNDKRCTSHYIMMKDLEEIVLSKIKSYINSYLDEESAINSLSMEIEINNKIKELKKELNKIETNINEKNKIIESLYIDKVKGIITDEMFINFSKKFSEEKDLSLSRKKDIESRIKPLMDKNNIKDRWRQTLLRYTNVDKLSYNMVRELIDYIEIGEKNEEGQRIIRVHWLF